MPNRRLKNARAKMATLELALQKKQKQIEQQRQTIVNQNNAIISLQEALAKKQLLIVQFTIKSSIDCDKITQLQQLLNAKTDEMDKLTSDLETQQQKLEEISKKDSGQDLEIPNKFTMKITEKLEKIQQLSKSYSHDFKQTYSSYNSSNYFHVGPRYQLLQFCRNIIVICKQCNLQQLLNAQTDEIDKLTSDLQTKDSGQNLETQNNLTMKIIKKLEKICQLFSRRSEISTSLICQGDHYDLRAMEMTMINHEYHKPIFNYFQQTLSSTFCQLIIEHLKDKKQQEHFLLPFKYLSLTIISRLQTTLLKFIDNIYHNESFRNRFTISSQKFRYCKKSIKNRYLKLITKRLYDFCEQIDFALMKKSFLYI